MKKQLLAIILLLWGASLSAQERVDTTSRPVAPGMSAVVQTVVNRNLVTIFPSASFTQQLQGRASGLFATSANGRPGSPAILTIRGQNSINGDSQPYYIVNGIPMIATQLSSINMEDIESVTILKDAISTAIYGVNGGNGVVVVETKKGRRMPLEVTVSAEAGFSKILKNSFGLMDTRQKLDYEKDLGIIDQATYNARLPYNNNPIDEIYRTAWLQQYNLQLSGGSDRLTYYLSGGYYTQDGIHHSSCFKRYTINTSVNIDAAKWLKTGAFLYVGKDKNSYPLTSETKSGISGSTYNLTLASILLNPYEQLKNSDGSYNKSLIGYPVNPLYEASLFSDERSNTSISGTGFLDIKLIRELNLRSSIILKQYEAEGYLSKRFDNNNQYIESSDHKATTMIQSNKLSFDSYIGSGQRHQLIASLAQEYNITNGSLNENTSELYSGSYAHSFIKESKSKILSGIFELKYRYKDYIIADATYRMDRLDLFSVQKNSTAKSWAVAAKWIAYDQSYGVLSRFALRVSTGKVAHLPLALTLLRYTDPLAFGYPSSSLPIGGNPWETTQTHNLGIDAYLFGNKLSLYADLYLKSTSDVLAPMAFIPPGTIDNSKKAKVENKGLELTLDWNVFNHYRYFLLFRTTLSLNQNKLKELPDKEIRNGIQILKEGKPLGGYYLARWAGVDPSTGEATWYDSDGNKTSSYHNAKQEYIEGKSSIPSKSAGLSISGGYKGFSLTSFFYGTWDIYTYNQNLYNLEISNGNRASMYNLTTNAASYWKKSGDLTSIPKPYSGAYPDTRLLQNHSYFRLKSLTLAYDFERRALRRLRVIEACKVFITAHNLFTISGYKGFTPEVLGYMDNAAYPESRTFSWGIKLTFK